MAIYFNAVGKIGRIKETEKFKDDKKNATESRFSFFCVYFVPFIQPSTNGLSFS